MVNIKPEKNTYYNETIINSDEVFFKKGKDKTKNKRFIVFLTYTIGVEAINEEEAYYKAYHIWDDIKPFADEMKYEVVEV